LEVYDVLRSSNLIVRNVNLLMWRHHPYVLDPEFGRLLRKQEVQEADSGLLQSSRRSRLRVTGGGTIGPPSIEGKKTGSGITSGSVTHHPVACKGHGRLTTIEQVCVVIGDGVDRRVETASLGHLHKGVAMAETKSDEPLLKWLPASPSPRGCLRRC